ncbi:MAG TPA: CehA/McbA family metallohydrolase [Gemmatimonadales bacterium]|nr:CehA/McbA family metallohydrolase [Gemmatimonadales bacterium]
MRRPTSALSVLAAALLAPSLAPAQREPVLRQVALPHAYYWREMYVPQATSGPSAVTWSPDGHELIYAMQGSLWRQRIGSPDAGELTRDAAYDYQPDWSPDGRFLVFARYANDAIELELLELATGNVRPITANHAVNVDPRWSPDGRRVAFVSTAYNARWHVFVVALEDGVPGAVTRLTEDNNSGLPRYYYSPWDHYLSPTWSPDGRELILISNRGHIHGTGGLWRMPATPGAPLREIHYEETTWKARPDWSPDGRRVVFSSYLGGQWHQLWLMTSEGGDVFPLTYGAFDATAPRWSHDGSHIAYISNEDGNTSVWIVDLPGARRQQVVATRRRYRRATGRLRLTVVDASGRSIPARVSVTGPDGRAYAPDDAWRHADEAFDRREGPFEYGYFHSGGGSELAVAAGRVRVEVWRGAEYRVARSDVTVPPGGTVARRIVLERLANLPARGWWSGDLHVHMNYGGAYRNTPAHLAFQARAEDLHLVENLVVNKEQRIPDVAAFRTESDPASGADLLLLVGQEYHTSYWGHVGLLGLRDHLLVPAYAAYPNTAAASLYPTNADVADLAHAQGALVGYAHPFDTRPDPADTTTPLTDELPVDVALGKVDYLEVMGYSDHLATSEVWYRLLNCGFPLPAGGGTDAFPNFASLRGPPGLVRVWVEAGPRLAQRAFLAGLKSGRTFVSNAPLLEFTLGGQGIGAQIRLAAPGRLAARVGLHSNVSVDHLEIVGNGRVVATIPLTGDRTEARATVPVPIGESGWYVLRAYADRAELPVLDRYPFASTSPVYVTVAGAPTRSPSDAAFFVRWIDRLDEAARAYERWNTEAERDHVRDLLARARAVYAGPNLSAPPVRPPGSP